MNEAERMRILREIKYILDCNVNASNLEIHISIDADKPYSDINVESHTMLHGL